MEHNKEHAPSDDASSPSLYSGLDQAAFRSLCEGAREGILVVEIATRQPLYANAAFARMFGYSPDEILDLNIADLYPPEALPSVECDFDRLAKGELDHSDQPCRRKDGSIFPGQIHAWPVTIEGRPCLAEFFEDITEARQRETRMSHLNAVLHSIRNVNQLITQCKDQDALLQGACDCLSETRGYGNAWIALLDEERKLVKGFEAGLGEWFRPMEERLAAGDFTHCCAKALSREGVVVVEDPPANCPDCPLAQAYGERTGMTARLAYDGHVYGVLNVSIPPDLARDEEERELLGEVAGDIAFALHGLENEKERKQGEEALRTAKELSGRIIEDGPVAITQVDHNGQIIFANRHAEELLGLKNSDIKGIKYNAPDWHTTAVDGSPFPDEKQPFQQVMATDQAVYDVRHAITTPNGKRKILSINGAPLHDANGHIDRVVFAMQDITERLQAEEALRVSEELHRRTLDSIGDGVIATDADGRVKTMNPVAEQLIGWQSEDVAGRPLAEVFHIVNANTRETVENPVAKVIASGKIEGLANHTILIARDGTEHQIADSAAPIRNAAGETLGVVLTFQDVTDEYAAVERLRESEADLRQAQCVAQVGSWQFDLNTKEVSASEEARRIYGIVERELTIPHAQEIPLGEYREPLDSALRALVEKGEDYDIEFRIRRPSDGAIRDIHSVAEYDADANVVIGTIQDITDRKEAGREKARQQALLEAIYRNAPLILMVVDAERQIRQINGYATQFAGRPAEEMLGLRGGEALRCLHALDDPEGCGFGPYCRECTVRNTVLDTLERDETHLQVEAELPFNIDGRERQVAFLLSTTPLSWEGERLALVTLLNITDRKEAETALRESEHRFRSFIENANDIVYAVSPEGLFTYISPNWLEFMGEPAEDAIGKSFEFYVHPDDMHRCREFLERVLTTETKQNSVEYRVRHRDGSWRWHVSNGSPLRDEAGNITGYVGIARDVTEAKRINEALKESEQRLQSVFNAVDGVPIQGYDKDRRVIFWNPASEKLYGYSRDEALGQKLEALIIPEESRVSVVEAVRKWHEEDIAIPSEEVELLRKSGERLQVYSNHVMITNSHGDKEMFCIDVDLTKRKLAEQALRRSETLLSKVLDLTPVYICAKNLEGRFLLVNKTLADFYGRTVDEMTGMLHGDVCKSEEELAQMLAADRSVIESGQHLYIPEETMESPDGSVVVLETHKIPFTVDGAPAVLLCAADVTEQKQMQERLRQMEKMDAIGQLAGGVAHDFNNQLGGIMGYADMLRNRLEDPKLQKYAENVLIGSRRAADLTKKLLAFARKGHYESIAVDVHNIIHEVVEVLSHSIDKRIEIEQILGANPSVTKGDPTQLQNALLNLAINAGDAMPEGGKLLFETSVVQLDETYCSGLPYEIEPGPFLRVSVTDSGSGIPKENLEHIFEPFFTTKEVGKGTGMGLAAVFGTIKQHGGAINVYSEVGYGTTFRIFLPVKAQAAQRIERSSDTIPAPRTATILVVDDEQIIRDLAEDMLSELGYSVIVQDHGEAGVSYYKANWQALDLVILDMVMPKMNGAEAYRAMKAVNPDVKVLLASGYSINGAAQGLLAEGVQGFIQKPFERAELSAKVAEVLTDADSSNGRS